MKFKKSQSGRSMVEMLGVLAIIGVLSVGGIAGYSLSMRRHRANQIVDYIAKYAVEVYGLCHQAIMDDSNSYVTDVTDCYPSYYTGIPSFYEDEDIYPNIGPLPAPIYLFGLDRIESDSTGTDTVVIYANFEDKKLCQTVGAITGSTCNNNRIEVKIKQN